MFGTTKGVPYKLDFVTPSDDLTVATQLDNRNEFYTFEEGRSREAGVAFDIQTGDLVISKSDIVRQTAIHRIWMTYEDRGNVDLEVSESVDSGVNWTNLVEQSIGSGGPSLISESATVALKETFFDFPTPTASRKHRIRIQPTQAQALFEGTARQKLKFSKLVIEYEDLGEAP